MSIQRSVLERLRKGDEQAFEVVYHAFHRRIYGFLLSSLGEDESAAEDLLQSFFLRLWEARSNIDVDKDFTAYLFTIARNLVYKELREKMTYTVVKLLEEHDVRDRLEEFYLHNWERSCHADLPEGVSERVWNKLYSKVHSGQMEQRKPKYAAKISWTRWLQYAAFVCVIAASFTLIRLNWGYFSAREEVSCKPFLVEAEKGQRACVTLPDGTRVWLNSHSRLEYSNSYGEKDRKVKLQGEAFFDVAKDSAREFVVDAGHLSVKVLGTTFNIKAYQEDDICVASLISGSIQTKIGEKSIQLQPDESIVYNKTNQNLHVERGLSERAMMWKNDELAFNGETLEEIAVILDRLYNVSFEFESEEIKSYRFTGVIKNNSLENVIELISLTSPISYKIMNSTIRIKKK